MPDPVVHHVELCVLDAEETLKRLKNYGFQLYAIRKNSYCKTLVARLASIYLLITERNKPNSLCKKLEPMVRLCCEKDLSHQVDTVYNLAFSVKKSDIKNICERIKNYGGEIIEFPTEITDENGTMSMAIVKSNCGNVIHTLVDTKDYKGFLPGFHIIDCQSPNMDLHIWSIDHVTLATHSGNSTKVIGFYEQCFGMNRFEISSNDDVEDGLILSDGVGLRLRAMTYWRCAETGLSYKNAFMLVVVESLPGQTNCNVETFLTEHKAEGIEHLALLSNNIVESVSKLKNNGVVFRNPPRLYYDELRNNERILELSENLNTLSELGILLDNETEATDDKESSPKKYLMQIFARPLFDKKTFFIEIIQRSGAKGLGSGNVLALVRSIREEERRNMLKSEAKTQEIAKEHFTSPRQC